MKPTSPLWYLAAFIIALGSWMGATVIAAGAWDPVRDATLTPATQRIDAGGQSLAVFTDIVQVDRDVTCRTTARDKKVTEIPDAAIDITVDDSGNQWHLIGLLPSGADKTKVTCSPRDKRVDDATYAVAAVSGFESRANTGKGVAILGTTAGAGLALLTFLTRRKRRTFPLEPGGDR